MHWYDNIGVFFKYICLPARRLIHVSLKCHKECQGDAFDMCGSQSLNRHSFSLVAPALSNVPCQSVHERIMTVGISTWSNEVLKVYIVDTARGCWSVSRHHKLSWLVI